MAEPDNFVIDQNEYDFMQNKDDDYEIFSDELETSELSNVMNVFLCYYKQMFQKSKDTHFFSELDNGENDNSTNRCMELLYDHMHKMSENHDKIKLIKPEEADIDTCYELYVLNINNEQKQACELLWPLIIHVSELDWLNLDWNIATLKSEY